MGTTTSNQSALAGYMNTAELAESLGVHPTTLVKWRVARKGPPFTRLGHRVLYNVERFAAWLEQQEVAPVVGEHRRVR